MPITAEMEQDTTEGAAARAQVSAHLATFGEEFASIGVQLGARYDGSPIIAEDGAPPRDDFLHYTPSGVPGGRTTGRVPVAVMATRCSTGSASASRCSGSATDRRTSHRSKPRHGNGVCR